MSHPAGNTSRHMGQLCSLPPPAASPSPLTLLCISSSSSSTTSSSFSFLLCRETCLSEALSWLVTSCLLNGPGSSACSPPSLSSTRPALEGPADDDAPCELWKDGCGFLVGAWRDAVLPLWLCLLREASCLSSGCGTGLACSDRSCWEELRGPGFNEVPGEGGQASAKGGTSSLRSHHRCSSKFSDVDLYSNIGRNKCKTLTNNETLFYNFRW